MTETLTRAVGMPVTRIEGVAKVTGEALYAAEYPLADLAFGSVVQSTIARGRIVAVDVDAALAMPGVLAVLTHENAPRLGDAGDADICLLQDDAVHYRGEAVALVVATSLEAARSAADVLPISYDEQPHDVVLTEDHPGLYRPGHVNPGFETDTEQGDPDAELAASPVTVDRRYSTPTMQNNPMEPHAATAVWDGHRLTAYDSTQGAASVHRVLTKLFDLPGDAVRVYSPHVGGGFGSKGSARPPVVLAAMAARVVGRPVRVVLTRQQMFALVGYRTPTLQRLRIGADRDGTLRAIIHDAVEQTSTVLEFAEQTTVATRMMYAATARRTTHRLAALDVPTPRWMRAPGECPGMFALESALDELAEACGVDPVELRIRNEPPADPESGLPFSSRSLVACLREGANRIGWADRSTTPGSRQDGRWAIGLGVAASTYPARSAPSTARATAQSDGRFVLSITAADIGTGARTALTQVFADEMQAPMQAVDVRIGDSDFGPAMIAGGSMGTASWSWAALLAAQALRAKLDECGGAVPAEGIDVHVDTADAIGAMSKVSRHAFGAQFAQVRVDVETGEVRVPRLVGVFGAGRVVNPKTARSQLIGGMTMGLSMALHEESTIDSRFGDYTNHDLAGYHIAANADVGEIDASWVEEIDHEVNPLGIKGIGEIGIVGTAAAIANAVYNAAGVRVRDLPIRLDRVLVG
ncbi:MAG: xanthine dehydrogenase [Pseudonocardiales bacterium]|nr:MAG: xanthine dehydrogenase [Pseudonocardiales bacterium]